MSSWVGYLRNVVRGLALYDRILAPEFLARGSCHHLVALLSRRACRAMNLARIMTSENCSECRRLENEIQGVDDGANKRRRGKLQDETPLPENPADWLLGFENDEAITDQLRAIGEELTRLRNEWARHIARFHTAF